MSKYVDRILDEVYFNFERHFDDDEKVEFVEELISELKNIMDRLDDDDEEEDDDIDYVDENIPFGRLPR
jgi:hypothetical protein